MVGVGRRARAAATKRCGVGIAIIAFLGVALVGAPPGATAAAVGAHGRSVDAAALCACAPFVAPFVAGFSNAFGGLDVVEGSGTIHQFAPGLPSFDAVAQPDRMSHSNLAARIVAAAQGSEDNGLVVDQYGHVAPVLFDTAPPTEWHGEITFLLRRPIVGIAAGSGRGYWLAASDGGVFRFGAFRFYGSMGGRPLNSPIVAIISSANADGYWLVAVDGGVFSFGSARFHGSTGNIHLARPIVGGTRTPSGNGYWLVASDGGVFSFGDARVYGSAAPLHLAQPVVSIATTSTGKGYWITTADHNILNYGDAAPLSIR